MVHRLDREQVLAYRAWAQGLHGAGSDVDTGGTGTGTGAGTKAGAAGEAGAGTKAGVGAESSAGAQAGAGTKAGAGGEAGAGREAGAGAESGAGGVSGAGIVAELDVLAVGLQDTPAGSAALALRQRTQVGEKLDQPGLVLALTVRGSPHVHRREDLAVVRGALWPRDTEMLRSFLGGFGDTLVASGVDGPALLAQVAEELRAIFPGEVATKGELSAAVSSRLRELACPWCESCGTAHVDDGLFRLATLHAGLELVPGEDRRLRFRLGPDALAGQKRRARADGAMADLLLAAVRMVGPVTLGDLAAWLATRSVTAPPKWLRAVWAEVVEGLVEVEVGGETLYAAAEVIDALGGVPAPPVARLLPPRDVYVLGHRGLLVPDRGLATQVWRPVGSPGVLVVGGDVAGTWRARKSGRTLHVTITPHRALTARQRAEVERQAEVVAAARGHDGKVVVALA